MGERGEWGGGGGRGESGKVRGGTDTKNRVKYVGLYPFGISCYSEKV